MYDAIKAYPGKVFQPTLPARGATLARFASPRRAYFNPRSPHGERLGEDPGDTVTVNFNPRSPHGERHEACVTGSACVRDFNPRSPHGERHGIITKLEHYVNISTHAPRTGSDSAK